MEKNEILSILFSYKDDKFKEFTSRLIPNISKDYIIGVKVPQIRQISKEIYNDKTKFINELPHKYLEENILHSSLISLNKDLDDTLDNLEDFLPYVDNWIVCDTISPKVFKKDLGKVYKYIKKWIKSKDTYTVRFGIVSLLQFYLDGEFKNEYNILISKIKSDEYYINMAIAWYYSFALIKQYDTTIKLFESKTLDKWIHNKSIQKAIESYRIDDDRKKYLKSLKI